MLSKTYAGMDIPKAVYTRNLNTFGMISRRVPACQARTLVAPGRVRSEELQLPVAGSSKVLGRESVPLPTDSRLAAGVLEEGRDLLGEDAFALHAASEAAVTDVATAQRADAIHHLVLAVGKVPLEPVLEELRDRTRKCSRQ